MQKIAVIYGGASPEHDVSILTGLHLSKHVTEDYQVQLVYLTRDNRFLCGSRNIDDYIRGKAAKAKPFQAWSKICCVVNCCHGGIGEDGTLAAYFQVLGIPITSCDFMAAWQQQSKIVTRERLTAAGFRQPQFQVVTTLDLTAIKLPLPLIVKPEFLGSSIGIAVVHNQEELLGALQTALQLGERAIVEEVIDEMREVNVAVMLHQGQLVTSGLEVVGGDHFFSFAEKYYNNDRGTVKKNGTDPDAEFLNKIGPQLKALAVKAYQLFKAQGVVRIDFMVQGEHIILNELNTVPGFMAYHLWLKERIPYGVIIDQMIKEAIRHRAAQMQYQTRFESDILTKNRQLVLEI